MKHRNTILSLVITCLAFAGAAEARKGSGALTALGLAAGAAKTYGANTLTVAQLKQCMILQRKIDNSAEALEPDETALTAKEQQFTELEAERKSLQDYLTQNENATFETQAQVDQYNEKVNRYNALIDESNRVVDEYEKLQVIYNGKIGGHNDMVNEFDSGCAGKQYYVDDMSTVMAELN